MVLPWGSQSCPGRRGLALGFMLLPWGSGSCPAGRGPSLGDDGHLMGDRGHYRAGEAWRAGQVRGDAPPSRVQTPGRSGAGGGPLLTSKASIHIKSGVCSTPPPVHLGLRSSVSPHVCRESRLEEGAVWRPLSQHPTAAVARPQGRGQMAPPLGRLRARKEVSLGCRPRSPRPIFALSIPSVATAAGTACCPHPDW